MTEDDIATAAGSIPDLQARADYLAGACRDEALRSRVETLLLARGGVDGATRTFSGAPTPGPDDVALLFLTPSARADSLGRLGHYEVLAVIGRGGFGIVLKAFDDVLHRIVAVKVLAPELALTSPLRKRFLREARSAAAVRHENVVQIYAVEESPIPHLVMEYIPGETLQQRIDRTGPLDAPTAVRIAEQVARGLEAAHAIGLIHRDVKPGNVLLDAAIGERVKLTDFGLARAADDASLTQSGVIAGTPLYMAPEQAEGAAIDGRADLFSLGSVLYAMVCGRPAFRAPTTMAVLKRVCGDTPRPIRDIIPEAPVWLCELIERLHAKNPDGRFQTAAEVAVRLAGGSYAKPPEASPERPRIAVAVPRSRRRLVAAIAGALALLAVVALGSYALTRTGEPAQSMAPVQDPPAPAGPLRDEWVPLFNGRDLTGWIAHKDQPGDWTVEDGDLVGRGPKTSHLFSREGRYENFHVRLQARINAEGDSGLIFRTPYALPYGEFPGGPEAAISSGDTVAAQYTGSLSSAAPAREKRVRPDVWFTLEVIAEGVRIRTRVDGVEMVDHRLGPTSPRKGHFALQVYGDTSVRFRNIEIRELPPTPPAPSGVRDFREAHHLDGAGLVAWAAALPVGFRPASVTAHAGADPPRFNAIAIRDGRSPRFELSAGLGDDRMADDFRSHAKAGWQPESVCLYAEGAVARRHVVWVRATGLWWGQMVPKGDPKPLADKRAEGLRPTNPHQVRAARAEPQYGATFVPAAGLDWDVRCDLSAEQFSAAVADARTHGWRPDGFDAADYGGELAYLAVFVSNPGPAPWEFRRDLSSAELTAAMEELRAKRLRPLAVSSHGPADDPRFTAVWVEYDPIPPAPSAEAAAWESSVAAMTAEEQVKAVAARLKRLNPGFDGAVRPIFKDGAVEGLIFSTDGVTDIAPVRGIPTLRGLDCAGSARGKGKLTDLGPLRGLPITALTCHNNPLTDLTPLRGMPLNFFNPSGGPLADLGPIEGMPLGYLYLDDTRVTDLAPLRAAPLEVLAIKGVPATDLTPLLGKRLWWSNLDYNPVRHAELLRTCTGLKTIAGNAAEPFRRAAASVDRVAAQLAAKNPGFDGGATAEIENGAVVGLAIESAALTDLSPIRALADLRSLTCDAPGPPGGGKLVGLGDLAGLKLTALNVSRQPIADLAPLEGMPLRALSIDGSKVRDLAPLRTMKLTFLQCSGAPIADLGPLKGHPLRRLFLDGIEATDLAPLAGMPLDLLHLSDTRVTDLAALKGMPLKDVSFRNAPIRDFAVLRTIETLERIDDKPAAEFWKAQDAKPEK